MDETLTKRVADDTSNRPPPQEVPTTRRVAVETPSDDSTRRVLVDEPSPPSRIVPLGYLQPGYILLDRFEVIDTLHPHETERPGIFVCKDGNDKVVVKVAALEYPPKPELWDKLHTFNHPNVLKVFETLEKNGLYYEVQEYCAGGSLKDWLVKNRFTPEWVMQQLVPQANAGLRYLHDQGIVHRDIKPANIYLRQNDIKGTIVLGDFDISSVLATDKTSRDTRRNAGTWEYMPPEAFPRFVDSGNGAKAARVTRTADYYSLGITMIELVLGTTSLHTSDLPDLFDFYLSGGQIELPTKPPEFVRLLRGLLIRDRHKRWSSDEVDRWIKQVSTLDDVQAILDDEYFSLRRAITPYTIGAMHATDLPSLAEILARHTDEALEDLLQSDRLVNWIGTVDMNIARAIDRDRALWRSEPDNCLFRCIMFLDRTRPFPIIGIGTAKGKQEWLDQVVKANKVPEMVAAGPCSFNEIRKLDSWLHLKPIAEPEVANRVGATLWQPSQIRFEEIAYIFDPTLPYSHEISAYENLKRPPEERIGARTPSEVVDQAYGDPDAWRRGIPACYKKAFERWQQGFLDAWMRQRGLAALAAKAQDAAETLKNHPYAAFEAYLRLLAKPSNELLIKFEPGDFAQTLNVPYGQMRVVKLRYKAHGVGIPFASVNLAHKPDGLKVDPLVIEQREGYITFSVDSSYKMPVSTTPHLAAIDLLSANCKIDGDRPVVRYRVLPARGMALQSILLGAVFGFLTLGGARLAVGAILSPDPINPNLQFNDTFQFARDLVGTNARYFFALLCCITFLYMGFRTWLLALRRSQI